MKQERILVNLAYLMLCVMLPGGASAELLDLEAARVEAMGANPTMLRADRELESARAGVTEARAALMPALDLTAGYTRTEGGPTFLVPDVDPQTGQVTMTEVSFIQEEQWSAGIGLGISIYDGGRSWALLRLARQELRSAELTWELTRREIELETIRAWHGLALARSRGRIAQAGLESAREHLRRLERMAEQGLVHRADLLRARTREASLLAAVAAAEGGLGLARDSLLKTLGRPLGQPVELGETPPLPETPPLEETVQAAAQGSPEILLAEMGLGMARTSRGIARASFLPRLDGFASTGYEAGEWEDLTDQDVSRAGLSLSLNLFAGLGDRARIRKAALAEQAAAIGLTDLSRGIELAVRAAHQSLVAAGHQLTAAELGVESAQEAHRITGERFQVGLATGSDVLDSQAELIQAETDRVQALHDLATARAEIARYAGA